jgi:hypothetical protein
MDEVYYRIVVDGNTEVEVERVASAIRAALAEHGSKVTVRVVTLEPAAR